MKKRRVLPLVLLGTILTAGLLSGCGEKSAKEKFSMPTGPEEASIYVEPVEGISDDFIRGVDISSILAQEKSGVVYYNENGEVEDVFGILAKGGVNYVRIRIWNDPYDSEGNGYGGGNNDVDAAVEIGKRATDVGMKVMLDFHYSDFWADPKKQMCPKAWEGMDIWTKQDACYDFTLEAMNKILDAGVDVAMVQLGNETNNGMSGEKQFSFMAALWEKGISAVRESAETHNKEIKTAVHFTNPENNQAIDKILDKLDKNNVEYDVFALSYYPFWHGTLENLTDTLKKVHDKYGKETVVAETSYVYTLEDGDGTANSCGEKDITKEYSATVQSQVNALRDVCAAVHAAGESALGVFYWEPAWIPVNVYDYTKDDAESVLNANKQAWETYGSGWASSYAASYDPKDAGVYYGGSSWDNQAWFDFTGHVLPSVNTYKYLKYGTTCDLKVDFANDLTCTVNPGGKIELPKTADVHFNDRSKNGDADVTWNEEDIKAVDINKVGEYTVRGTLEDGYEIKCTVKVEYINLLKNPSFEEADRSMYNISKDWVDYQLKESDSYTGEWAMHFYDTGDVVFTAEQTLTDLEPGEYNFSLKAQGGDIGDGAEFFIYVVVGDMVFRQDFTVDGWQQWQSPEIKNIKVSGEKVTVGVSVKAAPKAWGTFDDFYLCKVQ